MIRSYINCDGSDLKVIALEDNTLLNIFHGLDISTSDKPKEVTCFINCALYIAYGCCVPKNWDVLLNLLEQNKQITSITINSIEVHNHYTVTTNLEFSFPYFNFYDEPERYLNSITENLKRGYFTFENALMNFGERYNIY